MCARLSGVGVVVGDGGDAAGRTIFIIISIIYPRASFQVKCLHCSVKLKSSGECVCEGSSGKGRGRPPTTTAV